jgi:hypothetical protein
MPSEGSEGQAGITGEDSTSEEESFKPTTIMLSQKQGGWGDLSTHDVGQRQHGKEEETHQAPLGERIGYSD